MTTGPIRPHGSPEPAGAGRHDVQVTAEAPAPSVRLWRVAGRLDRGAVATVCRLIDAQLALVAADGRVLTDLVVDVGAVAAFEPSCLAPLHAAAGRATRRGIRLCMSGCGGRLDLLPAGARRQLSRLRTFPTAEIALYALAGQRGAAPRRAGPEHASSNPPAVRRISAPGHADA